METRRRNSNSGDKFSFPIIMPVHEQQDGEFEFGCVSTSPGSPNSPADRLFFNGKLLPHDFPCPPPASGFSYSRSTSRASSVSSKDSLIHSGRPVPGSQRWQFMATPTALVDRRKNHRHGTGARNQEPKLRKQGDDGEKLINKTAGKSSFGLRILRSFVSTCKECHAIQPSNRETNIL
nr:probable membrane-associated kinase regulator 1 [Ipomoea batatas]